MEETNAPTKTQKLNGLVPLVAGTGLLLMGVIIGFGGTIARAGAYHKCDRQVKSVEVAGNYAYVHTEDGMAQMVKTRNDHFVIISDYQKQMVKREEERVKRGAESALSNYVGGISSQ